MLCGVIINIFVENCFETLGYNPMTTKFTYEYTISQIFKS